MQALIAARSASVAGRETGRRGLKLGPAGQDVLGAQSPAGKPVGVD